jgi:Flp pilus assembly protein TadD
MAMGEFHLFIRRDAKDAIPYFERTIQSDPDSGEAYLDLGDAYLRVRQLSLAEQALQRAIQLEAKETRRCHYLLGVTYQGEGKKAEAQHEFATAQRLSGEEETPAVLH